MGWTTSYKPKGQDLTAFFVEAGVLRDAAEYAWRMRVIASALVGMKTYYAAVELTHKETGERRVTAFVILVRFYKSGPHNIGWKDLAEDQGPVESDCPARILDLLTEPRTPAAEKWRARCRANIAARRSASALREGDALTLGGRPYTVVASLGRRGYEVRRDDGARFRAPLAQVKRALYLKAQQAAPAAA